MVAPALGYGASGEHEDFPGTISIGHEALRLLLVELGRSACRWAEGVVFVNGHGGNAAAVTQAVELLRGRGARGRVDVLRRCPAATRTPAAPRPRCCGASRPGRCSVRPGRRRRRPTPVAELMPRLRAEACGAVSRNGVLGDPTWPAPRRAGGLLAAVVTGWRRELAASTSTATAG